MGGGRNGRQGNGCDDQRKEQGENEMRSASEHRVSDRMVVSAKMVISIAANSGHAMSLSFHLFSLPRRFSWDEIKANNIEISFSVDLGCILRGRNCQHTS